ncbi:MAG: hypothetical protein GEU88_01285 [Solirubrobacterales bacterium]|nr:hypothetical protein [Solirubrobacterales bacterium]
MRRVAFVVGIAVAFVVAAPANAAHRSKPKLSVKSVSAPPALAKAGASFEVTGKVANKGKRRARTRVRISLRETAKGAQRTRVASRKLKVRAHRRKRFETVATIPPDARPGSYRVVACVKRRGHRGPNRCAASESRVRIAPEPAPSPPAPPAPPSPAPTFSPGARTLGDPLLPQIGNGGYDAGHYAIDLDYDPDANVFDAATTTMTATATQNLSELSLDFQDLPVRGVTVDGAPASFEQVVAKPDLSSDPVVTQPMKLVVTPPRGIREHTEFTLAVDYAGRPQVFTDPDTSIEGWIPACYTPPPPPGVEVCDSAFVVGEPMGSQAWFPSNNYPSDKATFETAITVPSGDQAFGVGELAGAPTDNGDGTTTWSWTEDDPTSTYLVTATNGDFDYTETTATEAQTGRTLPVYDALDPSATPAQAANFATLVGRDSDLIDFLGERFGPYPFDSYGAVFDRAPEVGYALEVQTKSHFAFLPDGSAVDGGTASTYLHELAHMWFGDAVTLARWNDIWFNEGWAQFAEWEYAFEFAGGGVSPAQEFDDAYADPGFDWSIAPAELDGDPANLFATDPTYRRGGMTIQGYREIVGDDTFFDFARAIQREFAYANISTDQFIELAEQRSGLGGAELALLDEYFQQWLFGTSKPTITPDDFS